MTSPERILVLGYGNPGRLDDGLGPACVAALEALALPGVSLSSDYQLNVEDAERAAAHDVVIFVDAAVDGPEPFSWRPLELPAPDASGEAAPLSFSTHHVSPAAVVGLARDMFGGRPTAYVLGIRGYAFNEFGERLSPGAAANLGAAVDFMVDRLHRRDFQRDAAPVVSAAAGRESASACPGAAGAQPAPGDCLGASPAGAALRAAALSGSQR